MSHSCSNPIFQTLYSQAMAIIHIVLTIITIYCTPTICQTQFYLILFNHNNPIRLIPLFSHWKNVGSERSGRLFKVSQHSWAGAGWEGVSPSLLTRASPMVAQLPCTEPLQRFSLRAPVTAESGGKLSLLALADLSAAFVTALFPQPPGPPAFGVFLHLWMPLLSPEWLF